MLVLILRAFPPPEITQEICLFLCPCLDVSGIDFCGLLMIVTQEPLQFGQAHFPLIFEDSCCEMAELVQAESWNFGFLAQPFSESVQVLVAGSMTLGRTGLGESSH